MNICAECQYIGCPWETAFEPVDGWVAEETTVLAYYKGSKEKRVDVKTYDIKECPLYIPPDSKRRGKHADDAFIVAYCIDTGETKRYRNMSKVVKAGFDKRIVSKCLDGVYAEHKGWSFAWERS